MSMECVFLGGSIKVISKVLSSLSKISDEVIFVADNDSLILRAVSLSRSAFVQCVLSAPFFEEYRCYPKNDDMCARLLIKPLLTIFRNNIDSESSKKERDIVSCRIALRDDRLKISMVANRGVTKLHSLHYEQCQNAVAQYSKEAATISWSVTGKLVLDWLAFFTPKLDHVSIDCRPTQVILLSENSSVVTDPTGETQRNLASELVMHSDNFDGYEVAEDQEVKVKFNLKDFKTVLMSSSDFLMPVTAHLSDSRASPVIFTIQQTQFFYIDFVLAQLPDPTDKGTVLKSTGVPITKASATQQSTRTITQRMPDRQITNITQSNRVNGFMDQQSEQQMNERQQTPNSPGEDQNMEDGNRDNNPEYFMDIDVGFPADEVPVNGKFKELLDTFIAEASLDIIEAAAKQKLEEEDDDDLVINPTPPRKKGYAGLFDSEL
ncbi:cell cycle checkpoint control protein rad9a [Nowakowskiella sp. JEL0407]|nr:cell cycle checkpoint control protein rad9a [Nowakowskiella sp. JEL0407]